MGECRHRSLLLVAVIALVGLAAPDADAEWDENPLTGFATSQHHECGEDDLSEGEVQGHVPTADQESGRAEQGAPGTAGVSLPAPLAAVVDTTPYYCTLSSGMSPSPTGREIGPVPA